ncbi:MAG: hypothetical protein ACJAT7_003020 [Psychromonas sp.]|jgi:hypothetical protein
MRIKLFIEANEDGEWTTVLRSFCEYLISHEGDSGLTKFGILESLPIVSNLLVF